MANNEAEQVPKEASSAENNRNKSQDHEGSPPPAATPPPTEENSQELIVVNEHTEELDLNHGRIGKIENLEQLKNLQR